MDVINNSARVTAILAIESMKSKTDTSIILYYWYKFSSLAVSFALQKLRNFPFKDKHPSSTVAFLKYFNYSVNFISSLFIDYKGWSKHYKNIAS